MDGIAQVSRVRKPLVVFPLATLALTTACSGLEIQTQRDPSVSIPAAATYAWRPASTDPHPAELDPRAHNPLVQERIRRAIEGELASKGFRQGQTETAEFLVEYRVGLWSKLREVTEITVDSRGAPMRAYSGAYIGGPYGPPPSVTTRTAEVTEGSLLITLVERVTGKVAYQALARDEDVTRRDGSEGAIANVVGRLLKDLP